MLILLTIFLFILIPVVMLIFHLARPRFSIQGFLAVLAGIAGWVMVFIARSAAPQVIILLQWKPEYLFPISPSLLVDEISWFFALALASLAVTVLVTSIARLGQNSKPDNLPVQKITPGNEGKIPLHQEVPSAKPVMPLDVEVKPGWHLWASILILTSLGLVAVIAGNMLTLLLAWAALDITELFILLGQVPRSIVRERIILAFSAKVAGTGILLIATLIFWSQGSSLTFDEITYTISPYLLLAAALRLGVLPLHLPLVHRLPIWPGFGTVLRLVPASASFILLVRVSNLGITGVITPYLLAFTTLTGIFAAVKWLIAQNELDGRPFWLLGTASLSIAAAILNQPTACLVWAITSLLSGGFIFSIPLRHKYLIPLIVLGLANFSALPFSPTWQGVRLYSIPTNIPLTHSLFYLFAFFLLVSQSFLLAGLIRHALHGIFPDAEKKPTRVEHWVWFLYPIGLFFTLATHLLIGSILYPNLTEVTIAGWILGPLTLFISGFILYISWRFPRTIQLAGHSKITIFWNNLFSFEWLYRYLWKLFRSLARLFALISSILEGDGGIIWALVLFALIFVFLQR
jgi:hypothetical protein